MNYIYDIYLNFNKQLYDFFEWNKNDKLIHIKMIPIYKINEKNFKKLINNNIKLNEKDFKTMSNKTFTYSKNNKCKNCCLFCDKNNVIAIEFDDKGNSLNKSSLFISDELEILENFHMIKEVNLNFKILNKNINVFKTRKQVNEENFINNELKNIDTKKLNYIYFECFGKKENNNNLVLNRLLNMSKNSKTYKKLYNILKLTSTTMK